MARQVSALSWPLKVEPLLKGALVVGYVGLVALCFVTRLGPRLFWTIVLPLLPLSIVVMGFHAWRRICPLAFWGTLSLHLKPKSRKVRRVPEWMEHWFFVIAGGFLTLMLVVRLVLINGDGVWLGLTLIGLGLLAACTNFAFSGKTWCNFLCPVGVVERIYTEPNSLRADENSQCVKCTACKQHCPDIGQENAYWKDVATSARRVAYYAFPGVVLGFYAYYWLRYGDWEAYFDGRWTHSPASLQLAFGPGFFFAPFIPALAAAVLTLLGLATLSYGLFRGLEQLIAHKLKEEEHTRHLTLTLAAFTAFNIFYFFAGAPSLRLVPGGTRLVAFIVPLVSAMFLVKRWRRSSDDHMKAKSAKKLVSMWKFDTPPPQDPAEVFAFFQAHEQAHTAQLGAYQDTIREVLADGLVTQRDMRLLAQLRRDLGISEAEHRKLFMNLSEDERSRFDPAGVNRVEQRLQLQGYRAALTEALMHMASARELEAVRADYGIAPEVHEALLTELRGDHSPLIAKIHRQFEGIAQLRAHIRSLASRPGSQFAVFALLTAQDRAVQRIVDSLAQLGDGGRIRAASENISSPDPATRAAALNEFRAAGLPEDLIARLAPIVQERMPEPGTTDVEEFHRTVESLATSPDPYQRAGAARLIGYVPDPGFAPLLHKCLADDQALVREAAVYAAFRTRTLVEPEALTALRQDPDERVRHAVAAIGDAWETARQPAAGDQSPIRQEPLGRLSVPGVTFSTLATVDKILSLCRVPLFADLEPEDLHELGDLARERVFSASETLVNQNELADDLYVVITGQAVITVERNGQVQEVGRANAGDVIGEMSVVDGAPRSATVRCATESLYTLKISGNDFRRLVSRRPDLSVQMMKTMSLRLRRVLATG